VKHKYHKHLFVNWPESQIYYERNRCRRCNHGRSHSQHQKTSNVMMIKHLFDGATIFNGGFR